MNKGETFKGTKNTIDIFSERFNKNVGTRQSNMWTSIFKTIKNLEVDSSGNILPNRVNLKTLRSLRGDISKMIITPQYKKDLSKFLGGFNELKGINDTYYKAIASGTLNANKEVFNAVKNLSIDATKNSLLEAGINNEIIAPVEKILTQNITSGGSFQNLTENLRGQILGTPDKLGTLERYTKQITTDSLNQFNANYNETVSSDLGLEFKYYAGSIKDTSRQYCIDRINEGRFFHKKEVENTANEQWSGKIPGTNASNIVIYRGGFNCGHQWLAVSALATPKNVRDRAESKGFYKPKKD
jgi:hypothetical protein